MSVPASASAASPREQETAQPALPQLGALRKPRKSKNHKNTLFSSLFRPHVLASERVFKWCTPYSVRRRSHLEKQFPASHLDKLHFVLGEAVVPKTREG